MDNIWETKFDLALREGLSEEVTLEIRSEGRKEIRHGKAGVGVGDPKLFRKRSAKWRERGCMYQGTERDPGRPEFKGHKMREPR